MQGRTNIAEDRTSESDEAAIPCIHPCKSVLVAYAHPCALQHKDFLSKKSLLRGKRGLSPFKRTRATEGPDCAATSFPPDNDSFGL